MCIRDSPQGPQGPAGIPATNSYLYLAGPTLGAAQTVVPGALVSFDQVLQSLSLIHI